jgi:hypothetical protein
MSVAQKLSAIEALWDSLPAERVPSPTWHREILTERKSRVARGDAKLVEWAKAKSEIRRLVKVS